MKKLYYLWDKINLYLLDFTHGSYCKDDYREHVKREFIRKYKI